MRVAPRIGESCTVGRRVGGKFLVDDDTSQTATHLVYSMFLISPLVDHRRRRRLSLAPVGEYTYAR
jgi:hypothetical protein